MSGKRHERPATCTPAIYGLLCDCWDSEPSRRPGFDQIVEVLEFNWRKQVGVRRLSEQAKSWGRGADSSGDGGGGSAVATAEYEYTTTASSMVSDSSTTPTDANGFYPSIVMTLTAASPSPSEEIDSESVDSNVRQLQHADDDHEGRPAVADGAAGSSGDRSSRRDSALDFGYGVMRMTTEIAAASASAPTEIAVHVVAEAGEEEAIVPVALSGSERSTGKRTNPRTSASIQIATTAETGASARTAGFDVGSACAHLLMPQFGTPSTPGTHKFKPTEARQQRDALPIAKLRSTMEQTPDLLFNTESRFAAAAGGAVDAAPAPADGSAAATWENLAFWTARQYEDMLMMQPPLASPPQTTLSAAAWGSEVAASACSTIITAPLCERVASLKDVLEICLATELALTPPRIHSSCNFKPHMQTYVDPAIELIKSELEYLKADVASNPEAYRQLLLATTANARKIYQLAFSASVSEPNGGDPAACSRMMRHTAALESECRILGKQRHLRQQQPTSELIPLVLLIREHVPAFKHAVKAVVAHARQMVASEQRHRAAVAAERPAAAAANTAGRRPRSSIALRYRQNDQTKSPYRIIEKSLTKGPMQGYPDVRKVLDVFGCIIECADYDDMAAVVHGFLTMHSGGGRDAGDARAEVGAVVICRVKDRWLRPLADGWRDLILNVEVNGAAIFEVQVVLRAMVEAQTACGLGPSHKGGEHSHTHNQVRCFTEVFALLGMPVEASGAANLSYAAGEAALARGTNGGGGVDVGHGGGSMDLNPTYDLSTTRQGGKVPVGSAQLLPAKVVAV